MQVWDIHTGECLYVLTGHYHHIYSVAFNGLIVVSGGLDTAIRVHYVGPARDDARSSVHHRRSPPASPAARRRQIGYHRDGNDREATRDGRSGLASSSSKHGPLFSRAAAAAAEDRGKRIRPQRTTSSPNVSTSAPTLSTFQSPSFSTSRGSRSTGATPSSSQRPTNARSSSSHPTSSSRSAANPPTPARTPGQCIAVLQGHVSLIAVLNLRRNRLVSAGADGKVIVFDIPLEYVPLLGGPAGDRYRGSGSGRGEGGGSPTYPYSSSRTSHGERRAMSGDADSFGLLGRSAGGLFGGTAAGTGSNAADGGGLNGSSTTQQQSSRFQILKRLDGHSSSVTSVQFDDRWLISSGNDGKVNLYRRRGGLRSVLDSERERERRSCDGFSSARSPPSNSSAGPTSHHHQQQQQRTPPHPYDPLDPYSDPYGYGYGEDDDEWTWVRELSGGCDDVWKVGFRDDLCVIMGKRSGRTVMEIWSFRPKGEEIA